MKKATKWTMTAMVLLFAGAIATSAFGFGWGRGPGFGSGPCGGDFARFSGLELTADQKAQLTAMRDAQFKEIEPLREQMFAKRDAVRKLWLEPNPDQAKILAAEGDDGVGRGPVELHGREPFGLVELDGALETGGRDELDPAVAEGAGLLFGRRDEHPGDAATAVGRAHVHAPHLGHPGLELAELGVHVGQPVGDEPVLTS